MRVAVLLSEREAERVSQLFTDPWEPYTQLRGMGLHCLWNGRRATGRCL